MLHPCLPDFALTFTLRTKELDEVADGLGHELSNLRWLPVAEYGEWSLFVQPAQEPIDRVLFACLGSDGEYSEIAGGIANFIGRFATAELQHEIFGSQGFPSDTFFV